MNNIQLYDLNKQEIRCNDPIQMTANLIKLGYIVAIKGIGGYHLCCNAKDEEAVRRLRIKKQRKDKPLAIMAKDITSVEKICDISLVEKEVLTGVKKPIVLLNKKTNSLGVNTEIIPDIVAPFQSRLGIMLPYTDIHKQLFQYDLDYLVMTSANISGLPICYRDQDAFEQLKNIVDYYLVHNKEILMPLDDSVVKVVDKMVMVSRLGRSYAPYQGSIGTNKEIVALGGEQKSSICVSKNKNTYISQYLGDIKDYNAFEIYRNVLEYMKSFYNINPQIYVHDLNSDFLSSQYAKKQQEICIPVQHHHAHMAGCMGENGLWEKVIGVIYDGTGQGTDGSVWGGEFFVGSRESYERVGHLDYITLQGGEKVIKELWRNAICYLYKIDVEPKEILKDIEQSSIDIIRKAIDKDINCFESSSMGRLFDCVCALVGLRREITYDAQGAIELESQIAQGIDDYYYYDIADEESIVLKYDKVLRGIIDDVKSGVCIPVISAKFHNTIIIATVECVIKIRERTSLNKVVLSGGVFENIYLLQNIYLRLREEGFNVYFNKIVPINDGGISYGQLIVGTQLAKEGNYVCCNSSKDC